MSLHSEIYHSYAHTMHDFCQYPRLVRQLSETRFGGKVHVLGIGKAAWKMASLCARTMSGRQIVFDGFVLTSYGNTHGGIDKLKLREAGHPFPDENSLNHSAEIVAWLNKLPARDELVVLLSGGGSSLFEYLQEGTTLKDLVRGQKTLLKSGKKIAAVNQERSKLSLVKQGGALNFVTCRNIHVFTVSDVADNDPRVIASGPFTPEGEGLATEDGIVWQQKKQRIEYRIVADNLMFRQMLKANLKKKGFEVIMVPEYQNIAASMLERKIKNVINHTYSYHYRLKPPFVYLWGGETPVKVSGKGVGGRCSHLALAVAGSLPSHNSTALFCFATDGSDGIPRSGGAYVDRDTTLKLREEGISRKRALEHFDSYTALKAIHHILPAPLITTNVNDIFLLCAGYNYDFDFKTEYPVDNDQLCIC